MDNKDLITSQIYSCAIIRRSGGRPRSAPAPLPPLPSNGRCIWADSTCTSPAEMDLAAHTLSGRGILQENDPFDSSTWNPLRLCSCVIIALIRLGQIQQSQSAAIAPASLAVTPQDQHKNTGFFFLNPKTSLCKLCLFTFCEGTDWKKSDERSSFLGVFGCFLLHCPL